MNTKKLQERVLLGTLRTQVNVFRARYLWVLAVLILAGCHQLSSDLEADQASTSKAFKAETQRPIRALYLTDYSGPWHNYKKQQEALLPGLTQRLNMEVHMVGKGVDDTLDLLSVRNFADGYDVVIYNFCLPEVMDLNKIDNAIAQTRDFGTPAVMVHCAAHSFWGTSPSMPENSLELAAAKAGWSDLNGDKAFPEWWALVGIDSVNRRRAQALTVTHSNLEHPVTTSLAERFRVNKDELFLVTQMVPGLTPCTQYKTAMAVTIPLRGHILSVAERFLAPLSVIVSRPLGQTNFSN